MGAYDNDSGYARTPKENYCENWDEEKGCLNPRCELYDKDSEGNCGHNDKRILKHMTEKELKKDIGME